MQRALAAAAAATRLHALRRGGCGAAGTTRAAATSGAAQSAAASAVDDDSGEEMRFDVCVVGAGPAGLAAAIRIRQARCRARCRPTDKALRRETQGLSC
jgi:hypothetical protein